MCEWIQLVCLLLQSHRLVVTADCGAQTSIAVVRVSAARTQLDGARQFLLCPAPVELAQALDRHEVEDRITCVLETASMIDPTTAEVNELAATA